MLREIKKLGKKEIASICDHTFLKKPGVYEKENACRKRNEEFYKFLWESLNLSPYAVCVYPEDVRHAREFFKTKEKNISIVSVVGFPDGSWYTTDFKEMEAKLAIKEGASEIDMVLNREELKRGNYKTVEYDIKSVLRKAHEKNVLLKLILETSELTHNEIKTACRIAKKCGVDFIKTSTGFMKGVRPEDVRIIIENFERIKIAGGVNLNNIEKLLFAASGRNDGLIDIDPQKVRIGESSLLEVL